LTASAVLWLASSVCAADDAADDAATLELFEKHVRPTLIEQCVRCHGPDKQQGGLRLDSREGWANGGDSGPAIIAGQADSLLLQAIGYDDSNLEMPPRGKLPEQTIRAFETWVASGAADPRTPEAAEPSMKQIQAPSVQQGRSFWSFQPVVRPAVPAVNNDSWCNSDIDRFVLARLEQERLSPGQDADPYVLLRRLYYDLIGLPPTPAQIEQFRSDRSPAAYEEWVNRLLDSHHFGERWGRHWLDVVRYAESSGGGRTLLLPDAWRYRDYVIDALNDDVPYDRFVMEQIAGDLLECRDWNQQRRGLIATAFLLLGPTNYEMQDKDILEMDVVDEQLDTMGKAFLGMTIGCARCHDHKFDPIPARDYYAMAGIFKSTASLIHSNVSAWNTAELPLPPEEAAAVELHEEQLAAAKAELAQATKRWIEAGGKAKKKQTGSQSIDPQTLAGVVVDDGAAERIGEWTESTSVARFVGEHYIHDGTEKKGEKSVIYRPELPESGRYEVRLSYSASSNRSTNVPVHVHHTDGETVVRVNQKQAPTIDDAFVSLGVFQFDVANEPRVVVSSEGSEDGVVIADAIVFLASGKITRTTKARTTEAKTKVATAKDASRLRELKQAVDRLAKQVKMLEQSAPSRPVAMATKDDQETGDIHVAIRGLVHQPGPITPRGVIEVASWGPFQAIPSGQSGRKQLAEWLADERNPLTARVIVNRVWYWLIGRGIVPTVDNFGSMGQLPTHPELLDHLASSFTQHGWSIKQLIRQIVLSRVYQLSSRSELAAATVDPSNKLLWRMNRRRLRAEDIRDSLLLVSGSLDLAYGGSNIKEGTKSEYGYRFDSTRRSVYLPVFRNTLPEIFEVFDFADPNIQGGKRTSSTVASQALLMMNHPFVIQHCERAASNLLATSTSSIVERIGHAYLQVLGRAATEQELAVAIDLVGSTGQDGSDPIRWAMLYQVLFQCLDFRYLD
jgi:cytochrome c553